MVVKHIGDTIAVLSAIDKSMLAPLLREAKQAKRCFLAGNGGSFATVTHITTDLIRNGRQALTIGSNGSLLTMYANDDDYTDAAALELRSYASSGDLLICLSCSGISQNIVNAVTMAKELGIRSALLTSVIHQDVAPADVIVRVWSKDYAVIEDCHMAIGHWLAQELRA